VATWARAADLLAAKCQGLDTFAFKDPRIAKLLPFWGKVFAQGAWDVAYVVPVRHPRSVALSLAQRNGFDMEKGYLLWLDYLVNIVACVGRAKHIYVDFDRLVDAPYTELSRIASFLDLQVDGVERDVFIDEFLEDNLRHSTFSLAVLTDDEECPPLAREIYQGLVGLAREVTSLEQAIDPTIVNQWVTEFRRLRVVWQYIDRLDDRLAKLDADAPGVVSGSPQRRAQRHFLQLFFDRGLWFQ
jgi:hypothetical protein